MNLAMLLEMAAEGMPERIGIDTKADGITYEELLARARTTAAWIESADVERVVLLDANSLAMPLALFGAALSGTVFVPLSYRLSPARLRALGVRIAPSIVIANTDTAEILGQLDGIRVVGREDLLQLVRNRPGEAPVEALPSDPDDVAVLLFTSGTTGEPKGAVLRHRHLASYVISTSEFMGADPSEAALLSVPPYHVAGICAVLRGCCTNQKGESDYLVGRVAELQIRATGVSR